MTVHRYLVALGSNMRHHKFGAPAQVLQAALAHLAARGLEVEARSPVIRTAPLGPSRRVFANAAAIVATALEPPALLDVFRDTEARFGRTRGGAPWRARVLDLDIVLWDGGAWCSDGLVVPHRAFRERGFVLAPAFAIAPDWRDPISGLTVAQLFARLTRPRPAPR